MPWNFASGRQKFSIYDSVNLSTDKKNKFCFRKLSIWISWKIVFWKGKFEFDFICWLYSYNLSEESITCI